MSEEDLRYWLKNEDWYMSRHTREWLERTPPNVAANLLARIAPDARLESRHYLLRFVAAVAVAGFSPSGALAGKGPGNRKAGIRAALMLADLGDQGALLPLLRVFSTVRSDQSQYQPLIEAALLALLEKINPPEPMTTDEMAEVCAVAKRIWDTARDLPDAAAALLIRLLPLLTKENPAVIALLTYIVESPAGGNRQRVRDTVRRLHHI